MSQPSYLMRLYPKSEAIQQILRGYMNITLCRYNDYYDYDGDWGWVTANIDEDREQFYNLDIPLTTDDWYFSVFSISKDNGIGLLDEPVEFSSKRPLHFYCEAPTQVHRGESIGVR